MCYNHKRINGLNFTSVHGERTTPVSADQEVFLAERKAPDFKYTTYKGWLFAKAYKYYDEETSTVKWHPPWLSDN